VQNPAGPDGVATQRMSSGELAEKISGLWVNAKLFEKGLKLFDGENMYSEWTFCCIYIVITMNTTTFVFA